MKRKLFICLLASLLTTSAFAGPRYQKQKRKVANDSPDEAVAEDTPIKKKMRPYDIRFGVTLGLSSISDSESNSQSRSSFMFGLFADFREMRYFGLEVDGLYGIPTTKDGVKSEFYGA